MTDKMTREFKGNLLLEDRDIREPQTFLNSEMPLNFATLFTFSEKTKQKKQYLATVASIVKESWESIRPFSVKNEKLEPEMSIYGVGRRKFLSISDLIQISDGNASGEKNL